MSYSAKDKCGFMIYHLNVGRIGPCEMKRVINKGYCNGYHIGCHETGQVVLQCRMAAENGDMIWLNQKNFNSKIQTIGEFMKEAKSAEKLLKDKGLWDTVVGFHWDEPLLRGQTNDDFLAMTKAISEEFGKRIFPVFSAYEVTGKKGNKSDPDAYIKFEKYASKYITDIAFDSYDYDVRPEYQHTLSEQFKKFQATAPEITSGEMYYRTYYKKLKDLMIGEPNIWYYPNARQNMTWGGYKSDEDYCIAHLEFFLKLLKEEKHPGGLHLYNWKTWNENDISLDVLFDRENPERWERYEAAIQRVCKEVREMKLNF